MSYPLPEWAPDNFHIQSVELDRALIPYMTAGSGEPVVMLHGLSGSLDWWLFAAPALAEEFQVYLLDFPGYGRLGALDTYISLESYADWTAAWMEAAGLDSAHVIGHSMGGHIAIRMANAFPEHVRTLTLVAPAGVLPSEEPPDYVIPLLKLARKIPVALHPLVFRDLRAARIRTVWRASLDLLENNVLDMLESISQPSLVILGEEDPIIPYAFVQTIYDALPNGELRVIRNAGHLPMIDEPEQFNAIVLEFLRTHRTSG